MKNKNTDTEEVSRVCYESLEAWARGKMQAFLQTLLEEEVSEFLGRQKCERQAGKVDGVKGYRNGLGKPRRLALTNGTITLRRPRVRETEERFVSQILPLFKRRTRELGELLPELYLHGLAKGDFELALRGLLGDGAPLSPASLQRLKAKWQGEYEAWKQEDLSSWGVVYQWADGLYVKAGLEDHKAALLVIVVALANGEKRLVACTSGQRESKESWKAVLRELKSRGLQLGRLTVADGHLGIWAALGELHGEGQEQRCWNHKIMNVLDTLPKKEQPAAREWLKAMPQAETREACEKLRDQFVKHYQKNYPKAAETLLRDWERMVTFYAFPKEHWRHLRTSNVVESPFAAIRLRTDAAKRYKRVENATALIWKLLRVAERTWHKLNGTPLLKDVFERKCFVNGLPERAQNVDWKEAA